MENVNKVELGKKIRNLRIAAGHTQDDLAALLEQKRQVISYYENGTRTPSLEQLKTIAKEYNTTTDYLLDLSRAATNDKDMQFVCNYTGLSEKAVENLHAPAKQYPFYHFNAEEMYRDIKNNLLSNENLYNIINQFVMISNQFIKTQEKLIILKKEINSVSNFDDYRAKVWETYEIFRAIKADLYDCEKQLTDLLENLKGFNYDDVANAYHSISEIFRMLNNKQYGI